MSILLLLMVLVSAAMIIFLVYAAIYGDGEDD